MTMLVKGMGKLIQNLNQLEVNIPKALANAGFFAMQDAIEGPAKYMCPVDTGYLRNSIHTVTEINGPIVKVQTGTNVFYGIYVEFGTGKYAKFGNGRQTPWGYEYKGHKGPAGIRFTHGNKPQPFLTMAMALNSKRIPDLLTISLRKQLETAAGQRNLGSLGSGV